MSHTGLCTFFIYCQNIQANYNTLEALAAFNYSRRISDNKHHSKTCTAAHYYLYAYSLCTILQCSPIANIQSNTNTHPKHDNYPGLVFD